MGRFSQPQYKNSDLNQQNRAAIIRVYADETGDVTKATVQETTGIKALDEKLVNAVLQAKVKPFYGGRHRFSRHWLSSF